MPLLLSLIIPSDEAFENAFEQQKNAGKPVHFQLVEKPSVFRGFACSSQARNGAKP